MELARWRLTVNSVYIMKAKLIVLLLLIAVPRGLKRFFGLLKISFLISASKLDSINKRKVNKLFYVLGEEKSKSNFAEP